MSEGAEGLPEWLASIPMPETNTLFIDVAEGVRFPLDALREAREIEVGSTMGLFSIASMGLRQVLTELSERPGWKDLPVEPTSIFRTQENEWVITVGDRDVPLSRSQIDALIMSAQEIEE